MGEFRFDDVFVGNFKLAAQDPATNLGGAASDSIDADGQEVTVPITLMPAGSITGTVFAVDGTTPVADAVVSTGGRSATTDTSGVYRLDHLPLGVYTLTASKPGTDDRGRGTAVLNEIDQVVTANLTLTGLGTVRVHVVDADNNSLPGVQVHFSSDTVFNNNCSLCRNGSTDGDGFVTFADVLAGPFSVSAFDSIGMRGGGASGTVSPGQEVTLTITLEPAGSIFGFVFAPDGVTPAPNITVRLTPLNRVVTTAADGAFRFELVPIRFSPFKLEASDASGAIRATVGNIVLPAQDAEVGQDLILDGLGIVFGDVFTPTGAPAPGASVTINSQAPGFSSFQATTNEFGRYLVHNVPVGSFSVFASIRHLRQGGAGNGEVKFDSDEVQVDIQLLDNQVPPDTVTVANLYDVNNFIGLMWLYSRVRR